MAFSKKAVRAAHSPAARRKAVATMKRTRKAKLALKAKLERKWDLPFDAALHGMAQKTGDSYSASPLPRAAIKLGSISERLAEARRLLQEVDDLIR